MNQEDFSQAKKDFDRDGYVVMQAFISAEEVQKINEKLVAFIKNKVPGMPSNHVFYEDNSDPSTLKQLQDLNVHEPFFEAYVTGSRFERIAAAMLGEEAIGRNFEYFNKPSKIGKPTPPHQDNYYFKLDPPQAITMWVALENVDEENGCVRYIKGSHLKGMRSHGRTSTLGFSQGITDYSAEDFAIEIPFPAKPGDLLIHHSMTIHRADGNNTDHRTRKAFGLIYFGASAQEDKEAKKVYQQILQEERLAKTTASS